MVRLLAADEAEESVARAGHGVTPILQPDLDLAGGVRALLPLFSPRRRVESLRLAFEFGGSRGGIASVDGWRCQCGVPTLHAHPVFAARAARHTLGLHATHEGVAEVSLCLACGLVLVSGDLVLTVHTLRNRSHVLLGLLSVRKAELI